MWHCDTRQLTQNLQLILILCNNGGWIWGKVLLHLLNNTVTAGKCMQSEIKTGAQGVASHDCMAQSLVNDSNNQPLA